MAIDHSKSYQGFGIRAISHRSRLRTIFRHLGGMNIEAGSHVCDLGCSNGYITDQIRSRFNLVATGMDHLEDHLELGAKLYPQVDFRSLDLNQPYNGKELYDLVTCFETLEHVGRLGNAVQNIVARIKPGGLGLVSVPIEHGTRGRLKYFVKKAFGTYTTEELGVSEAAYRKVLFSSARLSSTRSADAMGFGTHFGFDYRDVDDQLQSLGANYLARNVGMSRFFIIS